MSRTVRRCGRPDRRYHSGEYPDSGERDHSVEQPSRQERRRLWLEQEFDENGYLGATNEPLSKPTLFMTIGAVGSGKSTYAEDLRDNDPNLVVVSPDAVREELTGDPMDQTRNREVWSIVGERVSGALGYGYDTLVDATQANPEDRLKNLAGYREYANEAGLIIVGLYFDTPLEECLRRNTARAENGGRNVPKYVIERMHGWLREHPPSLEDGFDELRTIDPSGQTTNIKTV